MQDTMLRTRRLILRPLHEEDWETLFHIWQDPDVDRFLWDGKAPNKEQCRELTRSLCTLAPHLASHFVLLDAESQEVAGFIGLLPAETEEVREIDFTIARPYWNRGFATEATRALLDYARDELGLEMVIGYTDQPNVSSRRVLEKAGFVLIERTIVRGRNQLLFTRALRCAPPDVAENVARAVEKLAR